MPQFPANIDLSSLNGSNGFKTNGGAAFASTGDVNGDGAPDLIVGDQAGVHIVFGPSNGFGANVDVTALNGTNGFSVPFPGTSASWGTSISTADVNGDGFADLIIGVATADPGAPYPADSGSAYVVFGKPSGFTATVDLAALNGADGFSGVIGRE